MNLSTYRLIGSAYSYVEKVEGYYKDAKPVTDIAILSGVTGSNADSDVGANRMLLEGKYLFDIIDGEAEFGNYKLIILPDSVLPDETLAEKLRAYLAAGGKLLASGESCTRDGDFLFDFGAKFEGMSAYSPTYLRPCSDKGFVNGITEYVMCNWHII